MKAKPLTPEELTALRQEVTSHTNCTWSRPILLGLFATLDAATERAERAECVMIGEYEGDGSYERVGLALNHLNDFAERGVGSISRDDATDLYVWINARISALQKRVNEHATTEVV
jgi:hypothetical protein